jgi:hypothetical protein
MSAITSTGNNCIESSSHYHVFQYESTAKNVNEEEKKLFLSFIYPKRKMIFLLCMLCLFRDLFMSTGVIRTCNEFSTLLHGGFHEAKHRVYLLQVRSSHDENDIEMR